MHTIPIHFLFICLSCLHNCCLLSQNLVPNPSFENVVYFDSVNNTNWHRVQKNDTPEYFNFNPNHAHNNIFSEYCGGIKPKSGEGFVGIFCYRVNQKRNIRNIREFIETPLIAVLQKDSLYRIEISLSLDKESNCAIKNFGVYFSEFSIQTSKNYISLSKKPQIKFNSTYLDSTNGWITLQAIYKAKGLEKYLTIGNFQTDRTTKTIKMVPDVASEKKLKWNLAKHEKAAYYYIDNVNVIKVPSIHIFKSTDNHLEEKILDDPIFNVNELKVDSAIVLRNINFEFNKHHLLPISYSELNKLYKLLVSNPNMRIKLEGHTDNIGGYEFNLELSIKRIEAVASFLIDKGIKPDRIEYAGYSFLFPLHSNDTEEGRKKNRRVSFKILEK